MSAVAKREEQLPLEGIPHEPQPVSILAVIERAARDPQVDADKMERMMALYERVNASNAKSAYMAELAEMQTGLPAIAERGGIGKTGGGVQSTYARWEDINDAIKPVLAKHGFALSFRTGQEDSKITVTGVLSHKDGHSESTTIHLPSDTSGSKNAVQAVGSSVSYGKRYVASALLNLTSRGEDDDGAAEGGNVPVGTDQVGHIRRLLDDSGADIEKFCAHFKIDAVPDLRARDFDRAVTMLNTRAKGLKK
jgi:hypothetical protein